MKRVALALIPVLVIVLVLGAIGAFGCDNKPVSTPAPTPTPTPTPRPTPAPPPLPIISVEPGNMSFTAIQATSTQVQSNPASQNMAISNAGSGILNWSVSEDAHWLNLSPASGNSSGEWDYVTVSVDCAGTAAGSYNAIITVSAPGASNTPQTVPVYLTIYPPFPSICYTPSALSFVATYSSSNPISKNIAIWGCGGGTLNWSVSKDAAWLNLSPTSGTSTWGTSYVLVSANILGMNVGYYTASIVISATGSTNTPQTIPVSLTINPPP